jgi:hypothetical protein
MPVRPAKYKKDSSGRREKTQLQLAYSERKAVIQDQRAEERAEERKAMIRQWALKTGNQLLADMFPDQKKGAAFAYRRPELIEPEEGEMSNVRRWERDCSDIILAAIESKRARKSRYEFKPGPGETKADGTPLTYKDTGYLLVVLVWSEKRPEVAKAA